MQTFELSSIIVKLLLTNTKIFKERIFLLLLRISAILSSRIHTIGFVMNVPYSQNLTLHNGFKKMNFELLIASVRGAANQTILTNRRSLCSESHCSQVWLRKYQK